MRRKLLLPLLALPLMAMTTSWVDDGWPPAPFQGDKTVIVTFTSHINDYCGVNEPGYQIEACEKDGHLILPNPNETQFGLESFARLSAHELGHANGWAGNHPRP